MNYKDMNHARRQYEADVSTYGRVNANNMWEFKDCGDWTTFGSTMPLWYVNVKYRRKPQGHKHAALMAQYAQDAQTHEEPWKLWQYQYEPAGTWKDCSGSPFWANTVEYRRKPARQCTVVLTEEQIRELLLASEHVSWENDDWTSAIDALKEALLWEDEV
jgi:hypothetical protein